MLLGCLFMFTLEYTFDQIGDPDAKLPVKQKIAALLGWPYVLFLVIQVMLTDDETNDEDDEKL